MLRRDAVIDVHCYRVARASPGSAGRTHRASHLRSSVRENQGRIGLACCFDAYRPTTNELAGATRGWRRAGSASGKPEREKQQA